MMIMYLFFEVAQAIQENQTFDAGGQGDLQLVDMKEDLRWINTHSLHISINHSTCYLQYWD